MPTMLVECCGEIRTQAGTLEHLATRDNKCQWTYEIAASMFHAAGAHPSHDDASRISTTVLTAKCLRHVSYEREYDYVTTLEEQWAMYRGTRFHAELERWAAPGSYAEARFNVADLGVQLPDVKRALPRRDRSFSGSPDLVDMRGILYDYKRTKEVPRFDFPWADHVAQDNVNRWLVDHADTVSIKQADPFSSPGLVSFDKVSGRATWDLKDPDVRARFVPIEWQELILLYVDDKGPKPIVVKEGVKTPNKGKGGGFHTVRHPVIWDDAKVEAYIVENYVSARLGLLDHIAPIPDGWANQSHILCGYCPFRGRCADDEREGK